MKNKEKIIQTLIDSAVRNLNDIRNLSDKPDTIDAVKKAIYLTARIYEIEFFENEEVERRKNQILEKLKTR